MLWKFIEELVFFNKNNKKTKSSRKICLSVSLIDFAIDIFPFYDKKFLSDYDNEIKPELCEKSKNGIFYSSTRSLLTIEKISIELSSENKNDEIKNLNDYLGIDFYFLKNSENVFKAILIPILLIDYQNSLSHFTGESIIQNYGFVKVLENSLIKSEITISKGKIMVFYFIIIYLIFNS